MSNDKKDFWKKERAKRERESLKNAKLNTQRVNKVVRAIGRRLSKAGWTCHYDKHRGGTWDPQLAGRLSMPSVTHRKSRLRLWIRIEFHDVEANYPKVTKTKTRIKYHVVGNHPRRGRHHSLLESKNGFSVDFIMKGITEFLDTRLQRMEQENLEQCNEEASAKIAAKVGAKKEPQGIRIHPIINHSDKVQVIFGANVTAKQAKAILPQLRKMARTIEKENRQA